MTYFSFAAFSKNSELLTWVNSLRSDCDLIECGQIHRGHFTVFLHSQSPIVRPPLCTDFFSCEGGGERFLKAFHKQNAMTVTHGLLILECETLSEMCTFILNDEVFASFQLLEVSRNALATGLATATFVNVDSFEFPSNLTGTYLAKLNPQLRSLY